MRASTLLAPALFLLVGCICPGQDIVEYSTGAARAGAAAGAKGVSKSVGGVFGSLSKTLGKQEPSEPVEQSGPSSVQDVVTSSPVSAASSFRGKAVRPDEVKIGMERLALARQFGRPLMKTSKMDGEYFLEVFYYPHPDEDMTVVTLRDGKVTAVSPPPAPQPSKSVTR